jgi:hypothetical protein
MKDDVVLDGERVEVLSGLASNKFFFFHFFLSRASFI